MLALNRSDLVKKELEKMTDFDEDHPLSMLAAIWATMRVGTGSEDQDVYTLCCDLTDRFRNTPLLLNLKAVAQMQAGTYTEALQEIKECQEQINEGEQLRISLTNEITILLHLGRLKESEEVFGKLKSKFPECAFVKKFEEMSTRFD